MKIFSITVNGVVRNVVNAQIIDTNDCFKASVVLELTDTDKRDGLETIESNNFCIKGTHFDYSDLIIDSIDTDSKITLDFEEINGDWALCFVYIDCIL